MQRCSALLEFGLRDGRLLHLLRRASLFLGQLGLQPRLPHLHRHAVQEPADRDQCGERDERPPERAGAPDPPLAVLDALRFVAASAML